MGFADRYYRERGPQECPLLRFIYTPLNVKSDLHINELLPENAAGFHN
jgi:hypothetical protein